LLYADINLLDKHKYHKEKQRNCTNVSVDVGLKVNAGETKYIFIYHHQNVGQNMT